MTAPATLHIVFMVFLLSVSAVGPAGFFELCERDRFGPLGRHEAELGIVHGKFSPKSLSVPRQRDCVVIPFCHPELVSGSHKALILLDAETSSA
jgi:hypothetical protein